MGFEYKRYTPPKKQKKLHSIIREEVYKDRSEFWGGQVSIAFPKQIRMGEKVTFVVCVDGVGTKILVAQLANQFKSIGIDAVAMTVNDVVCSGAQPFAFSDYLAYHAEMDEEVVKEIFEGIKDGCKDAMVEVVSGETAEMTQMLKGMVPESTFDLAGCAVGILLEKPILGEAIKNSDIVVGLESNGLHSNGFTLARPTLLKAFNPTAKYEVDTVFEPTGESICKELLRPTRIYVKEAMEALKELDIHGLGHVTGGGFTKLLRWCRHTKCGFVFNNLPPPPPIMSEIQESAGVELMEMYATFNMGIGFCFVLPPDQVDDLINICERNGTRAFAIGEATTENPGAIQIIVGRSSFSFRMSDDS